jgi:hypothetical protein
MSDGSTRSNANQRSHSDSQCVPDPECSKRCTQCLQVRPACEFLVSKFTADRLTDTCKPCILARAAEYRANSEVRAVRRLTCKKEKEQA